MTLELPLMLVLGYHRESGRSQYDHLSAMVSLPDVVEHFRAQGLDPDVVWMIMVASDGNPLVINTAHKDQDFD